MAYINNNAFEIIVTPSRKRKRSSTTNATNNFEHKLSTDDHQQIELGLMNDAFSSTTSSTPKTPSIQNTGGNGGNGSSSSKFLDNFNRFSNNKKTTMNNDKENHNFCGMEVKSISELTTATTTVAAGQQNPNQIENTSEIPCEIIRKPPKKKKKSLFTNEESACFVNSGLNLELPDKTFNPYEVKRCSSLQDPKEKHQNCFINPGLNIRAEDSVINPYEITRVKTYQNIQNGIENPALEKPPRILTLGIPFTPNIGCRINFNTMLFENSSGGSTDMLTEKVLFTSPKAKLAPIKLLPYINSTKETFVRRSLPIIKEESIDIGKELDCYQLELENSINEAKLKKNNYKNAVAASRRFSLDNIVESHTDESDHSADQMKTTEIEEPKTPYVLTRKTTSIFESFSKNGSSGDQLRAEEKTAEEILKGCHEEERTDNHDDSSFDDNIDFKAPAPFVRAYRKPETVVPLVSSSNDQITKSISDEKLKPKNKSNQITGVIRRSIRKLMHPNSKSSDKSTSKSSLNSIENNNNNNNNAKSTESNHIFESIRHSLRRKPKKESIPPIAAETIDNDEETNLSNSNDVTLTERQIFRSNTDEFQFERKISMRSSFRKTTKDMKHNVMKSVFKKNVEEYKFEN